MATTDAENSKVAFADMVLSRRSKLIFFVLNLALLVPFMVKNYSDWGLGGAVVLLLIAFYVMIVKPDVHAPAAKDIPMLLFFDVCVFLVMSYQALFDNFYAEHLEYIEATIKEECFALLLFGLAVSLFTPKNPSLIWLKSLGKIIAGAVAVLQFWSNGVILEPVFFQNGEILLALYLVCAVVWSIFWIIASYVDPSSIKQNNMLSNILLFAWFALCAVETQFMQELITGISELVQNMPADGIAWWQIILAGAVFVGCAVAAYDYSNKTMGADSLVLGFIASALVLLKVLMSYYFSFHWVVFLVFLVSSIRCLRNEQNRVKTLRLDSPIYLTVQLAVSLGVICLVKAGLWLNVVVFGVYALVFYSITGKENNNRDGLLFWVAVLSAPAAYAVAYIWQMRFAMETVVMIALALAVSVGVMIILHWPHPDEQKAPNTLKIAVCSFMVLLCLISMGRYGANVDIEFDYSDRLAVVEIAANGEDNSIQTVTYYWSDISGEMIGSENKMPAQGAVIPINGEKLTIVVTDIKGVVTTKTEWYPDWSILK